MKTYRDIDKYGMMVEGPNGGLHDAWWRTSLAHAAYGLTELWQGLDKCIIDPEKTNGILRHPEILDKTMSRDGIVQHLSCAIISDKKNHAMSLANALPKRISNRYKHTIGSWAFVQMVASGFQNNVHLWSFMAILNMIPSAFMNYPLKWLGVKKNRFYFPFGIKIKGKDHGGWYPEFYTVHLTAWMLHVTPNNIFKNIAIRLIAMATPRSNVLIRKLCGLKYDDSDLCPREGWQWQRLPWVKYHGISNRKISHAYAGYALDINILPAIRHEKSYL